MLKKIKNWIIDKAKRFKTWIIVGVLGVGVVLAAGGIETQKIPEHLQLKADKSKIINNKEVDWYVNPDNKIPQYMGKIKKYDYITNKKAEGKFLWKDNRPYTNAKILEENGREKTVAFYTSEDFYKGENEVFIIDHATTTIEAYEKQTKISFLGKLFSKEAVADTIYSGAGDGDVYYLDDAWDTIHDGTVGSGTRPTSTITPAGYTEYSEGVWDIYRGFFPIDTSAIPADNTVTAATMNIYALAIGNSDNDGNDFIRIVQTDQPNSTTLTTADFNNCGATNNPTAGAADIDIDNMTASQYVVFTLNATGLGWIKKSGEASNCGSTAGVTCLGGREGHDVVDSAMDVVGVNNLTTRMSEYTGTDYDPYLTVTYSAPATISYPDIIWFD